MAMAAIPGISQVTLSTSPAQLVASNLNRNFLYLCSTLQFAIVGSSTATSTQAAVVPPNFPFVLQQPNITTGKIWGIAPAATSPVVSVFEG